MFKKAEKSQSKMRLALYGISGSGKTYTALSVASGLGSKVALIDTERGSASKYADRFSFDVAELTVPTIEHYIEFIEGAEKSGYEVLVIDSMSHGWQELLQDIERIAKAKYKGNSWSAWSEGTPKQKRFINSLLGFNGHIIATMRSKTEYTVTQENGKTKPVRVGLQPEQGKGIEYEFDMLIEMSQEHAALVVKDRTGKYQDKVIEKPGKEFGEELLAWLKDGKPVRSEKDRLAEWLDAESDGNVKVLADKIGELTNGLYTQLSQLKEPRLITRLFEKCRPQIEAFESASVNEAA